MSAKDLLSLSERELLELPELSGNFADLGDAAAAAEEKGDWTRAHILWEYALIDSASDLKGTPPDDYEYSDCGYGIVILAHLYEVMSKRFGLVPIDPGKHKTGGKAYPAAGNWKTQTKKLQEYKHASSVSTSKLGVLLKAAAAVLLAAFFFLLPYPFSETSGKIINGGLYVLVFGLAVLVGIKAKKILAGLISLFPIIWVLMFVEGGLADWLGDKTLADAYILRFFGVAFGGALLVFAVIGLRNQRRLKTYIAQESSSYASRARRLYRHASACLNAAHKITEPGIKERDAYGISLLGLDKELVALEYQSEYESHDRWKHRRVKGGINDWKDADQMLEEMIRMRDFYGDMKEKAKEYLPEKK